MPAYSAAAVRKGQQIEMEHTSSPVLARQIAIDHLREDPLYYEKLVLMEAGAIDDLVMPLSDYRSNPDEVAFYSLLRAAGGAAGAYHGYKRNSGGQHALAWAIWWAFWGVTVPVLTVPIAMAQGFGEQQ